MLGHTDWFDLPVANLADAMSFYEGLLGWTYQQMEESPLPDYVMVVADGKLIGGLRGVQSAFTPRADYSVPIIYFAVEKLGKAVLRAKELGADIVGQAVDLGKGRGSYQWIRDREGNLIGLWGPQ
jgi:uncharacterized protein